MAGKREDQYLIPRTHTEEAMPGGRQACHPSTEKVEPEGTLGKLQAVQKAKWHAPEERQLRLTYDLHMQTHTHTLHTFTYMGTHKNIDMHTQDQKREGG